jgi:hypothetical protein
MDLSEADSEEGSWNVTVLEYSIYIENKYIHEYVILQ